MAKKPSSSMRLLSVSLLAVSLCFGGDTSLSDEQIATAIALGTRYRDPDTVWNKEFQKTNKLKMSSYWGGSGSKYVSVVTDYALVAMAAAQATHEMRDFGLEQARALPGMGKLRAVLEIGAMGDSYIATIVKLFGTNQAHMVWLHDGLTIQPEVKAQLQGGYFPGMQVWQATEIGNSTIVTNNNAFSRGQLTYIFVYDVKGQQTGQSTLVLVGRNNKKFQLDLKLAQLR